jgi:hypothetical protein
MSYSKDWCNDEQKAAREGAKRFALKFPRILHLSYGVRQRADDFHHGYVRCPNYPCLFCDNFYDILGGASWVRFQMCPACQADYAKADFGKIHNELIDYLKKAGVKIVKAGDDGNVEAAQPGR